MNYCNTNFDPDKKGIYPVIFLCSFKSSEDFKRMVDDLLSIACAFPNYFSFLFPPLGNETLIPSIRYEYLTCVTKLSLRV